MELLIRTIICLPFLLLLAFQKLVWFSMVRRKYSFLLILRCVWFYVEQILVPLFAHVNVSDIKVDNRILFLVSAEKLILWFSLYSPKRLNCRVIEFRRTDIRITFMSASQMFFEQEIICCSYMIMLISFNTSWAILQIKIKFCKFGENLLINRHTMVADHYPTI